MFPGSRFFELPFANSLALYASAFFFLSIANFAIADPWADGVAYLLPMAGVAGLTFVVPGMALDALGTGIALIGFMAAIAVFVFLDSRQICLFLIDTGLLFDRLFGHMGRAVSSGLCLLYPLFFHRDRVCDDLSHHGAFGGRTDFPDRSRSCGGHFLGQSLFFVDHDIERRLWRYHAVRRRGSSRGRGRNHSWHSFDLVRVC